MSYRCGKCPGRQSPPPRITLELDRDQAPAREAIPSPVLVSGSHRPHRARRIFPTTSLEV